MSFNHTDNGYLILKNFRQPQDSLLQRFVKIKSDGSFEAVNELAQRLVYGSMMNTRLGLIFGSQYYIARMATIGTRYSF